MKKIYAVIVNISQMRSMLVSKSDSDVVIRNLYYQLGFLIY
jgi:hypothetical protein